MTLTIHRALELVLAEAHDARRRYHRQAQKDAATDMERAIALVERHCIHLREEEINDHGGTYEAGETCIATFSGLLVDLARPVPHKITLEDIAHHLALVNRFTGATTRPVSVAEHSCLVLEIVEWHLDRDAGWSSEESVHALRYTLLHDAPEYVLGDVSRPLKRIVKAPYCPLEDLWEAAILKRFDVPPPPGNLRILVKQADVRARYAEGARLMPQEPEWQDPERGKLPPGVIPPEGIGWEAAEARFLKHAARLGLR